MIAETRTVILVGMAQQKGVDVESPFGIPAEALAQHLRDVGRRVIRVIGGRPNIDVDEDLPAALKLKQRHVAVAYGEKRDLGCH